MDHHPPAIFVGDAVGLDFLNSIATPVDRAIDWIDDGEGLLRWLEQARQSGDSRQWRSTTGSRTDHRLAAAAGC